MNDMSTKASRERPILFSAPMVRAILEGRKTQTRRVAKVPEGATQVAYYAPPGGRAREGWADPGVNYWTDRGNHIDACPYGQSGDGLWLREAYRFPKAVDDLSPRAVGDACIAAGYREPWCPTQYEADGARTSEKDWREFGAHPSVSVPGRYRHARFMPRWASRITLELTGVRVERVQSISYADIVAEGVTVPVDADTGNALIDISTKNGPGAFLNREQFKDPEAIVRAHWAALWCEVNGRESWDANPWVWALTFKRVEVAA